MKSLSEVMGSALSQVARRTGSAAALQPVWARVVGELVARHTRPVRLDGATLVIRCDAPAWHAALEPERAAVLGRLKDALGGARELRLDGLVFELE